MKACIILFGEAFRLGNQHTRNTGAKESYHEQMKASHSHMKFIHDAHLDADVYISSYSTKFDNDLLQVYQHVHPIFHPSLIGQVALIQKAIHSIPNLNVYDFVLILRIDLFLKPYFTTNFTPWNTIRWPSICFKPYHKTGSGHPRVNDTMLYVPKKYFPYLDTIYQTEDTHAQWEYLLQHSPLTYEDLDTMVPTYHDSDSNKDNNPLYYIVNRPESSIHHNKGHIFRKYHFKPNLSWYIVRILFFLGIFLILFFIYLWTSQRYIRKRR